jgi:diketogulonate reductase-like aldo/keto reductase
MPHVEIPSITLNDGLVVPVIGFGTSMLNGSAAVKSIVSAIDVGYRLLDTAFNYENEGAVGEAIRRSGVPREQLLVTSKLPGRHHNYQEAIATIEEMLYRAQLDYCDLCLIHWPNPSRNLYVEAWQALVEAKKRGLVRSIGVSNFLPEHLERIVAASGVTPSVNQIELHPHFTQCAQRDWNTLHGIVTESWSPIGRASNVLQETAIVRIANKQGKTAPQIILRWHYQPGVLPLPKATSKAHQIENFSIFDFTLSDDDMKAIASLTREDGRISDQDPSRHEEL